MVDVLFLPDKISVTVPCGTTISEAAQKAGIFLAYPCGGRGSCGRCTVIVDGKTVLACKTPVSNSAVHIPSKMRLSEQAILTDIRMYEMSHNKLPLVERIALTLSPPAELDLISDAERLCEALSAKLGVKVRIEASCLWELPNALRIDNYNVSPVVIHEADGACVISFSKEPIYGIAADIGTTTVAVALCDVETGYVLDTVAKPNAQAEYGSDVITRIVYTEETKSGMRVLQESILNTLSGCIEELAVRANISAKSIPLMTIAANTVMSHFILGIPADYLRREPYIPAARIYPAIKPIELGLPLLPSGRVIILPSIASYVGGDITAGVIATCLPEMDGVNLLVDVGTNGEMVLAGPGFMTACSCSAGPAFEGSGISCGSRAVRGAIDNVYYSEGQLVYEVIGEGAPPSSICGTGLISMLSALLQKGIINRSGRFTTSEKQFEIAPNVTITEDDILNLIRAKAALFAGMRILVKQLGMSLTDIDTIYIAGGFGRSLNIKNAISIGMLPPLPEERYKFVGNTSLAGALRALCDRSANTEETALAITNVELSIGNEFMDEFVMACFLPHTELDFEI